VGRFQAISAIAVCLTAAAHADAPKSDADRLFEEGRALLTTHPDQACDRFEAAIKLDPDAPGVMLNLGLCNEKLGKYKTALYWFRKAQVRATESNLPEYVKAAAEHTTSLAKQVARVNIRFREPPPSDAKVKIDGEVIAADDYTHVEVDPGHHTLDAGAPGKKIVHQEFDTPPTPAGATGVTMNVDPIALVAGENTVIVDHGAGRRKVAEYLAIGGGVLMVGSGVLAWHEHTVYCDQFMPGKCEGGHLANLDPNKPSALSSANHAYNIATYGATTMFIVGAAAVGAGIVMYFTAPEKERIDRTVFVPMVSPDQIGLSATGRF
jgi:hypothetical protein